MKRKSSWAQLLAAAALSLAATANEGVAATLRLTSVSSPPAYVSGDDVVVRIAGFPRGAAEGLTFRINGQPTRPLKIEAETDGSILAHLSGLHSGRNRLTVAGPGEQAALTLEDHALASPLFSGPPLPLVACSTQTSGLGPALDRDCSAVTKVQYFYHSTAGAFKPLATGGERPTDLAFTNVSGVRRPYVVRVESGTVDRSIYRIAVLDDGSSSDPGAWRPGAGWNKRLVIFFGGGCGMHFNQGGDTVEQVLSDPELSQGFAYAVSPGLVNQQFCSPLHQAELLVKLKERFIKAFDEPIWTLGSGASGGSIQQLEIVQMFPGLLDGIQPGASFPDGQLQAPMDCALLRHAYAADPGRWIPTKQAAVDGVTVSTCTDWTMTFAQTMKPVQPAPVITNKLDVLVQTAGQTLTLSPNPCGVSDLKTLYDKTTNPKGLRCSEYDFQANLLGRDARGRVHRPFDNVGIQYGLLALQEHAITLDDFLILNATIGGYDEDGAFVPGRTTGDPQGIANAYATGLVNSGGGGLALVPIVTERNYFDTLPPGTAAAIHDRLQDFIIRARLERSNGDGANDVIWTQNALGYADFKRLALDLSTRWLDALAADPSPLSHAKVVRLKPADALDACWDPKGTKITEPASMSLGGKCNAIFPLHGEPRMVAGAGITNDVLKCALKPIDRNAYGEPLTDAQFAALKTTFPAGVCDYAKPSLGFTAFKGPLAARR